MTHGGVDGKTRLVVFLKASDNNCAETVAMALKAGTDAFGWPSRVRADWGGENEIIKAMMTEARGPGCASFLAGPLTHNQCIERKWGLWLALTVLATEATVYGFVA